MKLLAAMYMIRSIVFFIVLIPTHCFSQNYKNGDTLFVWSIDGTSLMSNPSSTSTKLRTLELGASIVVTDQDLGIVKDQLKIDEIFELNGHWVKVMIDNYEGFVFDVDFSSINPNVGYEKERSAILLRRFLGLRMNYEEIKRTIELENTQYEIIDEVYTYENGRYTYTPFDGCFDHTYTFKDIGLNEVYHLLMNLYVFRIETIDGPIEERPHFIGVENGTYKLSGTGLTGEIQIRIKGNVVELYSYDCT